MLVAGERVSSTMDGAPPVSNQEDSGDTEEVVLQNPVLDESGNEVPELLEWLTVLSLSHYQAAAQKWIDNSAACQLEELVENAEDFADQIGLKKLEKKRVLKEGANAISKAREQTWAPPAPTGEGQSDIPPWRKAKVVKIENELLKLEGDNGLSWCRLWENCIADVRDDRRSEVRKMMIYKVMEELGIKAFGVHASIPTGSKRDMLNLDDITLFVDHSAKEEGSCAGGVNLLGRYDVLCVRAHADINGSWNWITTARDQSFWVLHAAAINIGESTAAPDFYDFAQYYKCLDKPDDGYWGLDEDRYVAAMGCLYRNIFYVCATQQIAHLIFFPFGMGAFLRYLPGNDAWYRSDMRILQLRRRLASCFMTELTAAAPECMVYLCISDGTGGLEAACNADAFLRAVLDAPESIKQSVTLCPGADSLELAHALANGHFDGSRTLCDRVALVNGANRQLIGNHWFEVGAARAIDENLHRRSWLLAAQAYLLNGYRTPEGNKQKERGTTDLADTVSRLGGQVIPILPKGDNTTEYA